MSIVDRSVCLAPQRASEDALNRHADDTTSNELQEQHFRRSSEASNVINGH